MRFLDLQANWVAEDKTRPLLHLIFIEVPEAHLHTQLQQVFIRNILELLKIDGEDESIYHSQTAITTHSPHILYEPIQPIVAFRRHLAENAEQTTEVINLSTFYNNVEPRNRDFLQRYLKLTHCDLFFADAAILVEGNVERLLLPEMIEKEAISLRSACLCILEVGGAFGHRFRSLIEFLGLITLIITDIDSVKVVTDATENNNEDDTAVFEVPSENLNEQPLLRRGETCLVNEPSAVTSNQTLIQWLPKKQTITELLAATTAEKTEIIGDGHGSKVHIAYQIPTTVRWGDLLVTCVGGR